MTYVGDGLHFDPCCQQPPQKLQLDGCVSHSRCVMLCFCHPAETGSRVEIEFASRGAINVNGCSALLSPLRKSQLSATALAGFISLSPLLRRVVSCRPSLHRRQRKERGLRRHYTKHPSEAIISYDSSHAYSRTLSPVGPLSNLIVSAPTPPSRANTRRRGSALDVDLLLLSLCCWSTCRFSFAAPERRALFAMGKQVINGA